MKKTAGIVIVVVVLLVLGAAPAGVGLMAENHYRQLWQAALADQPGYSAMVTDYERGWFSSSARVDITITDAGMVQLLGELDWIEADTDNNQARLRLHERIHHGPLALGAPAPAGQRLRPSAGVIHTRLGRTLALDEETLDGLDITTRLGLGDRLHSHLRIEPVDYEFDDGSGLTLSHRMTLDVHADQTLQWLRSEFQGKSLQLHGAEGETVILESIRVQTDQHRSTGGVWLGDTDFSVGLIGMTFAAGLPLEVRELQWRSHASEAGDLLEQKHTIRAASIESGGFRTAPVQLDVTLLNLDTGGLVALQERLAELPPPHPDAPADDYASELLEEVRGNLREMARHGPGLRIDKLSLGLDGGALEGDGRLVLAVSDDAEFDRHLDQGNLTRLLQAEGRLTAGRTLVRKTLVRTLGDGVLHPELEADLESMAEMQIDEFIAQGLVVESGDNLEIRIQLEDGVFHLNQREIWRLYPDH